MGMSQEFPELQFVPAKAFGTGRDGRKVKLSVIHYTAGSERSTSAEDGASYDQRRTDGTSCHLFHDQNSSVQTVYRWNRANSAFHKGNRLGVQHELCGTAQTRAQWLDPASDATLWRAAKYVADDCVTYNLQPRRLTVAETRATWYSNGPGGICGHVDITRAFPEDNGTHEDPGPGFPWDVFLARVNQIIKGGSAVEGDPMAIELANTVSIPPADAVPADWNITTTPGETQSVGTILGYLYRRDYLAVAGLVKTYDAVKVLQNTPPVAVVHLDPAQMAQLTADLLAHIDSTLAAKVGEASVLAQLDPRVHAARVEDANTAEDS
jgi:hypothetical protein